MNWEDSLTQEEKDERFQKSWEDYKRHNMARYRLPMDLLREAAEIRTLLLRAGPNPKSPPLDEQYALERRFVELMEQSGMTPWRFRHAMEEFTCDPSWDGCPAEDD